MTFRERLAEIEARISSACLAAGRRRDEVTLVAVSKAFPVESIEEAYEAGLRIFGESKLQEALPKIGALPKDIEWHFVGKLQSNKARKAADLFKVIHSIESETQLRELAKGNAEVDVLIEVNIAEEPQKSGILPGDLDRFVETVLQCPRVRLKGLMTIGPALLNAEEMRPYFRTLHQLGEEAGTEWLSMGMSSDFDVAIQEGATHIRVGSALFGERA